MEEKQKLNIKIRKYDKGDHQKVCKLFYDGLIENWVVMYRSSINLQAPVSTLVQVLQMIWTYHLLNNFTLFLLGQFFIQMFIMIACFFFFWIIAW